MGLYKRILNTYQNEEPVSPKIQEGLLVKAEQFLTKNKDYFIDSIFISFHEFAIRNNLKKTALLLPKNDSQYEAFFSHGLTTESNNKMSSTIDFWNGTIPSFEWFETDNESINYFYQFFSENDSYKIKKIYIKKILLQNSNSKSPAILIIADDSVSNTFDFSVLNTEIDQLLDIIDFSFVLLNENLSINTNLTEIEMNNSIENGLAKGKIGNLIKVSPQGIYKKLSDLVEESDLCYLFSVIRGKVASTLTPPELSFGTQDHEIHVVLFSDTPIDCDLYEYQLIRSIRPLFSNNRGDFLRVELFETTSNKEEIENFLLWCD